MSSAIALRVAGVTRSFGDQVVLSGVDFEVPAESMTAVLGASGSGKTTLLRILAGFDRPDRGVIWVDGSPVDDGPLHVAPQNRGVGYVPQEGALFPHLDVAANIGFGLARRRRRARVAELLELTGLGNLGGRYPHQLSGGQQQRVALARALATAPRVMLLDEPFSSLDASLRSSFRTEVQNVVRAAGTTAVLVTHDQDEALSMADSVAVLRQGRFVQCGPPDEVYSRPVDPDVANFVGAANLLAGVASGDSARTALGVVGLACRPGPGPLTVMVRPEQMGVATGIPAEGTGGAISGAATGGAVPTEVTGGAVPAGGTGTAAATVERCEYYGHDSLITVRLEGGDPLTSATPLMVRMTGRSPLRPGARVSVFVKEPVMAWPSAADPSSR